MNTLHDSLMQFLRDATSPERLFNKRIMHVDEVAKLLKVSKGHIYNLTSRQEIPFHKKGRRGRLYFIAEEIFDWVSERS